MTNLSNILIVSFAVLATTMCCFKCALVVTPQTTTETEGAYVHVPRALYELLVQSVKTQNQQNDIQGRVGVLEGKMDSLIGDRNQIYQYYLVLGEVRTRVENLEEKVDVLQKDNRRLTDENVNLTNTITLLQASADLNNEGLQRVRQQSLLLERKQNDIQRTIQNVTERVDWHEDRFGIEHYTNIQNRFLNLEEKVSEDRNKTFYYNQILGEVTTRVEYLEDQNHVFEDSVQRLQKDSRRITEENNNLTSTIQALQASTGERLNLHEDRFNFVNHTIKDYGSAYIRWGRKTCGDPESNSTELIYAGQVGGAYWLATGAAVNALCLSDDPKWGDYDISRNLNGYVNGAIISTANINVPHTPWDRAKYNGKGIYCALCRTRGRSSVIMIPGRNECYPGWTMEYHGYLAAGRPDHKAATEYTCLDSQPDIYPIQKVLYHKIFCSVEAYCDGPLSCPPYEDGKEITCVVCSK